MSDTIQDGGLIAKDPNDQPVLTFDWDARVLPVGVSIASSTFVIEGKGGDMVTTPVTKDQESILSGNRQTQVRLAAGAAGSMWRINNRIVTNETPSRTIERSFYLFVEDR
jgi:hypothetical protein